MTSSHYMVIWIDKFVKIGATPFCVELCVILCKFSLKLLTIFGLDIPHGIGTIFLVCLKMGHCDLYLRLKKTIIIKNIQ